MIHVFITCMSRFARHVVNIILLNTFINLLQYSLILSNQLVCTRLLLRCNVALRKIKVVLFFVTVLIIMVFHLLLRILVLS